MFGQHTDPSGLFQPFLSRPESLEALAGGSEKALYLIERIALDEAMPDSRD
jgi:hypothetical protein